jgi:hypothetical protein
MQGRGAPWPGRDAGSPAGVELEQGKCAFGRELADRCAPAAPGGEPEGGNQAFGGAGAIDRHREGAQGPVRLSLDGPGTELAGFAEPLTVGANVGDRGGTERESGVDRIQGDGTPRASGDEDVGGANGVWPKITG